jgi:hypothetical protein
LVVRLAACPINITITAYPQFWNVDADSPRLRIASAYAKISQQWPHLRLEE